MAFTLDIPYYYDMVVCVELLGMHELKVYRMNWREKRRDYDVAGIRMGENLVCFVCNNDKHIDSQKVTEVLINLCGGFVPRQEVWV